MAGAGDFLAGLLGGFTSVVHPIVKDSIMRKRELNDKMAEIAIKAGLEGEELTPEAQKLIPKDMLEVINQLGGHARELKAMGRQVETSLFGPTEGVMPAGQMGPGAPQPPTVADISSRMPEGTTAQVPGSTIRIAKPVTKTAVKQRPLQLKGDKVFDPNTGRSTPATMVDGTPVKNAPKVGKQIVKSVKLRLIEEESFRAKNKGAHRDQAFDGLDDKRIKELIGGGGKKGTTNDEVAAALAAQPGVDPTAHEGGWFSWITGGGKPQVSGPAVQGGEQPSAQQQGNLPADPLSHPQIQTIAQGWLQKMLAGEDLTLPEIQSALVNVGYSRDAAVSLSSQIADYLDAQELEVRAAAQRTPAATAGPAPVATPTPR